MKATYSIATLIIIKFCSNIAFFLRLLGKYNTNIPKSNLSIF